MKAYGAVPGEREGWRDMTFTVLYPSVDALTGAVLAKWPDGPPQPYTVVEVDLSYHDPFEVPVVDVPKERIRVVRSGNT